MLIIEKLSETAIIALYNYLSGLITSILNILLEKSMEETKLPKYYIFLFSRAEENNRSRQPKSRNLIFYDSSMEEEKEVSNSSCEDHDFNDFKGSTNKLYVKELSRLAASELWSMSNQNLSFIKYPTNLIIFKSMMEIKVEKILVKIKHIYVPRWSKASYSNQFKIEGFE